MRVGAAWRLKAVMGVGEAGVDIVAAGRAQQSHPDPSRRWRSSAPAAWRRHSRGAQMLFAAGDHVRHHGGTERIHIAVGVAAGEHVLIARERIEPGLVVEILQAEIVVAPAGAALRGEEQVFRHGVGLVPGPGDVVLVVHAPGNAMLDGMAGQMRERSVGGVFEDRERLRVVDIGMRIEQAEQQLVVGVGREAILDVEVGADGLRRRGG